MVIPREIIFFLILLIKALQGFYVFHKSHKVKVMLLENLRDRNLS